VAYIIKANSKRAEKSLDKLFLGVSKNKKRKVLKAIARQPNYCKKRGKFRCYSSLPNAQRILFITNDKTNIALILFVGNHDEYMKALKKYS